MKPRYATQKERDAAPCYIARHSCGRTVAVFVADDPEHAKDVAKEVAGWIRRGWTVERVTVARMREGGWCDCFDEPVKSSSDSKLEARGQTNMLAP